MEMQKEIEIYADADAVEGAGADADANKDIKLKMQMQMQRKMQMQMLLYHRLRRIRLYNRFFRAIGLLFDAPSPPLSPYSSAISIKIDIDGDRDGYRLIKINRWMHIDIDGYR